MLSGEQEQSDGLVLRRGNWSDVPAFTSSGAAGALLDESGKPARWTGAEFAGDNDITARRKICYNTLLAFVQLVVMFVGMGSVQTRSLGPHIPASSSWVFQPRWQ